MTRPYGKCKGSSYTSVRHTAHKILFFGRRTTDMSHVDEVEDGVGYGMSGSSRKDRGTGVYGYSDKYKGVWGFSNSCIHTFPSMESQLALVVATLSPLKTVQRMML